MIAIGSSNPAALSVPSIRVTRADGATATLTGAFRFASPFDPNGCNAGGLRGGRAVRH